MCSANVHYPVGFTDQFGYLYRVVLNSEVHTEVKASDKRAQNGASHTVESLYSDPARKEIPTQEMFEGKLM